MAEQPSVNYSRRKLLIGLGGIGLLVAIRKTGRGILRFMEPPLPQPAPGPIIAGPAEAFAPDSLTFIPAATAWLGRDSQGYFAVSAVCPHLGCTVTLHDTVFECPCHGSRFNGQGNVLHGPADSPLRFVEVRPADNGQLLILPQTVVPATARIII
jgi:cytochrome b6-f complex iron-sulfur subunit